MPAAPQYWTLLLSQFSAVNKCAPCTYISDRCSSLPTKGSSDSYCSNYVQPKQGQILLILTFHWNRLSSQVEPHAGDSKHFALLAFLYPVNFFYYFLYYTDTASTLSVLIVFYVAQSQLEIELDGERKLRKEQVSEESPNRNDRSGQLYGAYSLRCLMQQSLLLFVSPNPNPNTALLILPLLTLHYSRTHCFWKIFNRTDIMCVYNDETDKCSVGIVYRWHYDAHSFWANDTIQVFNL